MRLSNLVVIIGLGLCISACQQDPKTGEWGVKKFNIGVDVPAEIRDDINHGSELPNTGNVSDHYSGTDDLFCPEAQRKRGECQ